MIVGAVFFGKTLCAGTGSEISHRDLALVNQELVGSVSRILKKRIATFLEMKSSNEAVSSRKACRDRASAAARHSKGIAIQLASTRHSDWMPPPPSFGG